MELLPQLLDPIRIERELHRRSFYDFFKSAWVVLEPETPLEDNWHIKYICDRLQLETERIAQRKPKERDLIINIPPRSLKTMLVTIMWNAWTWIKYPHISYITSSYSGELALEHSVKTRRLIESDWYKERFNPDNGSGGFSLATDQNVKSRFENDKGGSRRATSVGGTVTGGGADIIIVDDPIKVKDAYSELARQTAIDWWDKTMFSRLNDQRIGFRVVIMQRVHEEDLTGHLLAIGANYELISLPADAREANPIPSDLIDNYVDGLFFPARFDRKFLEGAKISLGSRDYAGQYLEAPAPAEGNLIKREWFKTFRKEDLPEDITIDFYTDSAYGKQESDNSATIAYSYHQSNLYIWHCWAWNLPFPDFIKKYQESISGLVSNTSSRCIFEPKASGVSIIQELRAKTGLNIIEDNPPTESKMSRVSSVSSVMEAGRVYLYEHGNGFEEMVHEAIMFPNGKNDDRLDAVVGALLYNVNKINMIFTSVSINQ